MASALFGKFETVVYSEAGLLAESQGFKSLAKQDANSLRIPFWYLLVALDSLGQQAKADVLANGEAVLIGAKNFLPPVGLGAMRSQSCYVVILRGGSKFDFHKYLRQAPVVSTDRTPIWNWSAKLNEFGEEDSRASSVYATQIGESYVLLSNDLEDLLTVAQELTAQDADFQGLNQIPEWQSVSQHDYWGYRHYRHTGVVNTMAAGMTHVTSSAQSFMFSVDFVERVGVLRLLASDDGTAGKIDAAALNGHWALPLLKPSGTGAWEARIPLKGDQKSDEAIFHVMVLFGFGISL